MAMRLVHEHRQVPTWYRRASGKKEFVIITARVTMRQPNSDNAFFFSKGNARNAGIYSLLDTDVLLRGLASIEMKMAC